jgi:hypothetical protein
MRRLHPISFHERFLASGEYVYEQDDKPTGIRESWTIHHLPDGSRLIRVDRDARQSPFGMSLLLEALLNGQRVQRFDLQLFNANGLQVKQAKASYQVFEDSLQVSRQINDAWQPMQEMPLTPGKMLYPLMRLFTGSVIRQIIAHGGRNIPVITPDIANPDSQGVLAPKLDYRSAEFVAHETLKLSGSTLSASRYRFVGGNYPPTVRFGLTTMIFLLPISTHRGTSR